MGEVVNIFSRVRDKASKTCELSFDNVTIRESSIEAVDSSLTLEQIALKNADIQTRMRRERAQANDNVLKSYRIK